MIDSLRKEWEKLAYKYIDDESIVNQYWSEILKKYSSKSRHYHNLYHLYNMFNRVEDFKDEIFDLDVLKFSIWYHDIIYKSTRKDNEKKSADISEKRLKSLRINEKRLNFVKKLIVSTKNHQIIIEGNTDNAIFLDLDLSILGTDWHNYKKYTESIRREYAIYPDFMYNNGRKKVLNHFLERKTLYFTQVYQTKFETKARENLIKEIELL